MTSKSMVQCPLCASQNTKQAFLKESIPYYDCMSCSFRFSKPALNANFQSNMSDFEDAYLEYFGANTTDQLNLGLVYKWLNNTIPLKGRKVLDIGCGSGKFADYLRERGANITGLEPSKPLFEKFLKGRAVFVNGDLDDLKKLDTGTYELITTMDVLEHIEEPVKFVKQVASLQKSGDLFCLEIPLYDSVPSKIFGKNWHFYHKYHLSYFSKKRLIQLMADEGYTFEYGRFRGKYFSVGYLFNYFVNFILHGKSNAKMPFAKTNIYLNIFDIYFACFRKK